MKYNNVISYQIRKHSENPNTKNFYIAGICNSGSRHYSEDMTYEDALAVMPKYSGIVEYFGGGIVELIEKPYKCLKIKIV